MHVGERVAGNQLRGVVGRRAAVAAGKLSTAGSGRRPRTGSASRTATPTAATSRRRATTESEAQNRAAPRPIAMGTCDQRARPTRASELADDEAEVPDRVARAVAGAWRSRRGSLPGRLAHRSALHRGALAASRSAALRDEIDHQRDALELVVLAHPVLEVVGPVAGDQPAVVHLDRDPRRAGRRPGPCSRGAAACRASAAAAGVATTSADERGSAPASGSARARRSASATAPLEQLRHPAPAGRRGRRSPAGAGGSASRAGPSRLRGRTLASSASRPGLAGPTGPTC